MGNDAKFWNDCYADGKTGWDRGEVHPALTRLMKMGLLRSPASIVVPGCGRGYEVVELAKNGFDVTAIEIANEPVQYLQQRLDKFKVTAKVVQKSIFEFQPTKPVDFVYEQTCLCAIDPKLRTKYEQTVYNWLKPDGELFVLFAQTGRPGDGPPFHCSSEEIQVVFPGSRWIWVAKNSPGRFEHPSGKLFELAHILMKRSNT